MLRASFAAYYFIGVMEEVLTLTDWDWRSQLKSLITEAQACQTDVQMQILRSALCLQFFQPVTDSEVKQSFCAAGLSILVLSVAHKAKNLQDRYYTLLLSLIHI